MIKWIVVAADDLENQTGSPQYFSPCGRFLIEHRPYNSIYRWLLFDTKQATCKGFESVYQCKQRAEELRCNLTLNRSN